MNALPRVGGVFALGASVLAAAVLWASIGAARADDLPPGYVGWTISPDEHYVIAVPKVSDPAHSPTARDEVLSSGGRLLGEIIGQVGLDEMHNGLTTQPGRWSADSDALLWRVNGKWGAETLVLLHLGGGTLQGQTDLLAAARKEIMSRTRQANPRAYADVGQPVNGSLPHGFTISVTVAGSDDEPLAFPLSLHAELNSNPDDIVDVPNLRSRMDAEINEDGTLSNIQFHYGE